MALVTQKIFNFCPNYDNIVNYKFSKKDIISKELIDFYEDYVFNCNIKDKEAIDRLQELDEIMNLFVKDLRFNEYVKASINSIDEANMEIYTDLIFYIIDIYNKYENKTKTEVKTSRWL